MPSSPQNARAPATPPSRGRDVAMAVGCVLLGLAYGAFLLVALLALVGISAYLVSHDA